MNRRDRSETRRQLGNSESPQEGRGRLHDASADDADVVLDVHELSVKEVNVDVEKLQARLSLEARIADLMELKAGVDVDINDVNITLSGVGGDAHLRVRLNEVREIIDRTFTSIDQNPELYREMLSGRRGGLSEADAEPSERADQGRGILRRILPGGGSDDSDDGEQTGA